MNTDRDHTPVTDADLVAYIDGALEDEARAHVEHALEADTALRARHDQLEKGGRPFSKAYDLLLDEAPVERLNAILGQAKADYSLLPKPSLLTSGWRMVAAAAAVIAFFAAGTLAGSFLDLLGQRQVIATAPAKQGGWLQAVVEYQKLFVRETLEARGRDPGVQGDELRRASDHLGIALSREKVSAGALDLKRTDIYRFNGKPLVQVAYLFDGQIPVSFCIISSKKGTRGPDFQQREGFNIVHWHDPEFGFMVIGKVPRGDLEKIAAELKRNLS